MEKLSFTKNTSNVALVAAGMYVIYGFLSVPYIQFLVSLATFGIVYGITSSFEFATIALLSMNFLFPILGGPTMLHFNKSKEGFVASSPTEVSARIQSIQKGTYGKELAGVASPMTEGFAAFNSEIEEGFEDASGAQVVPKEKKEAAPTTISEQGVPPANQPATAIGGTAGAGETVATTTPASGASTNSAGVTTAGATAGAPAPASTSGFQDNGSLFKLGQIPTDTKGGFHIDAGTTVVNALQALKPDQIKSMTADTKQLIETQKSLMGMLQTFQPMMMEGKAMMDTFNQMFAPTTGAAGK